MSSKYVNDYFVVSQLAKEHGALVVSVEHRFYGASNPLPTLNNDALKYLSSEQALADFAAARVQIVDNYFGKQEKPQDVKVVAFGGSYSGNLAAWIVQRYGHLFVGSIAASAPVEATVPFTEYMDVVSNSLPASCNQKVKEATEEMEKMMETAEGRSTLSKKFNTCKPVTNNSEDDVATFFSSLTDPICGVVQYNLDNKPGLVNITAMCKTIEGASSAIDGYAAAVKQIEGDSCIISTFEKYMYDLQNTLTFDQGNNAAAMRSWIYQTCTEFGYYQFTDRTHQKQPFSKYLTLDWFKKQCTLGFNIPQETLEASIDATNMVYGARYPVNNPNIFYSYGTIDPWHYLQVNNGDKHVMEGTAHCAILYPEGPADLPSLTSTRKLMRNHLSKLLQ
eukprot:CAMPEP_0117421270 /NCGR_PEP_ID=MMETSP0758-20121206/2412_1 /TAXON_ID=63605 /ORGANISM="Percolomonas cosmopolitus, Strain AE-1 (ATCC 50343)" /LENGTH=391 /DNA_ID=CAMNT_0005203327 /DNA_START=190 /DNA_END=1365 /DNA_ORIENTATION=+